MYPLWSDFGHNVAIYHGSACHGSARSHCLLHIYQCTLRSSLMLYRVCTYSRLSTGGIYLSTYSVLCTLFMCRHTLYMPIVTSSWLKQICSASVQVKPRPKDEHVDISRLISSTLLCTYSQSHYVVLSICLPLFVPIAFIPHPGDIVPYTVNIMPSTMPIRQL